MRDASLPLAGLRVLDFSRLLPGPWATQFLGDMGAEVIKIEQPEIGDPARHNPPTYREGSVYFHSVNRNKRCIALDLSKPAGREIALRLIDGADILVESFRRGVTSRLGIDEKTARARNPRLIYCSITGYGQDGPLAAVPGHDLVIQSITGLMAMHPEPGAPPPVPGFQAADYAGATGALSGLLVALFRRERTGEGAYLDISMFDNLMAMSNIVLTGAMARAAGHTDGPTIEVWGGNPRYSTYATRDGKAVAVSLLETRTWERFCHHIGRPDLIRAEETPRDRHSSHGERSDLYRAALTAYFAARDRDEAVNALLAADIPICSVSTPDEALAQPQVVARGVVEWIDHPIEGRIPQLANPLGRSGFGDSRARPAASRLGADTDAVLRELGYDEDACKTLHQNGVIA
jgi:CoA:oxalate CoA-transferase